jgi:hypothetical protein
MNFPWKFSFPAVVIGIAICRNRTETHLNVLLFLHARLVSVHTAIDRFVLRLAASAIDQFYISADKSINGDDGRLC